MDNWVAAAGAIIVALVSAAGALLSQVLMRRKPLRLANAEIKKAEADAAASVVTLFEKLVTDLQEERAAYKAEIAALQAERLAERQAYRHEIGNLKAVIQALHHYASLLKADSESLVKLLRRHGIEAGQRPKMPDDVAVIFAAPVQAPDAR